MMTTKNAAKDAARWVQSHTAISYEQALHSVEQTTVLAQVAALASVGNGSVSGGVHLSQERWGFCHRCGQEAKWFLDGKYWCDDYFQDAHPDHKELQASGAAKRISFHRVFLYYDVVEDLRLWVWLDHMRPSNRRWLFWHESHHGPISEEATLERIQEIWDRPPVMIPVPELGHTPPCWPIMITTDVSAWPDKERCAIQVRKLVAAVEALLQVQYYPAHRHGAQCVFAAVHDFDPTTARAIYRENLHMTGEVLRWQCECCHMSFYGWGRERGAGALWLGRRGCWRRCFVPSVCRRGSG